jgi:hypothetical protein
MSRKQGPPKGGRGAPAGAGDLTPEAAEGGRRPHASEFGSHPHLGDGAPAPPHRPPQPRAGDATGRDWCQTPTLPWRESEQWFGGGGK